MLSLLPSWSKGALVAVALLGVAPSAGGAPQAPVAENPRIITEMKQAEAIVRAVAELAHPDAGVRERASRYLWLAGRAATAALEEAAESGDPEVATRARSILLDFRFGIYPDTPKEMRDIIVEYRDGQANDKVAALGRLWQKGRQSYPVIVRLWLAESDERMRAELYTQMTRVRAEMASAFIAEEEYEEAEKLLESGAKGGEEASIRGLAAYWLLRGESEAAARRLREGGVDGNRALLLAHLHRARGDEEGMRTVLPLIPVALREQLLLEMGDWAGLAALKRPAIARGASIEQAGLLAAYQRLARDEAGLAATMKLLESGDGPSARTRAVALVMNGRPGEGLELLRKSGSALAAFQLHVAQQQYGEALELAERARPEVVSEALRLSATSAAVRHHLGEKKRAEEMFEALAQQSERSGSPAGLAAGLEAALRWDIDEQIDLFTARLLGRSRPITDPAEVLGQVFPRRGEEAAYWWGFFREEHAGERPEQSMKRVRRLVEKVLAREEVVGLARRARGSAGSLPRHWRYKRLEVIGATLLSYEADGEAEEVLRELAQETGRVEAYLQLGLSATRQRKWEAAAEYFSQAMQRDRSQPAPRFMRGWALVQLGQGAAGKSLMEQAIMMPLADDAERYRLAEALREAGLPEEEARQYELILSTGPGHSETVGRVLWRRLFDERQVARDPRSAARIADRMVVALFGNLDDFEVGTYLGVAHRAEKSRALALVAEGKVEEALAVAHACFEMMPASSNLVIEMSAALEAAGRRANADELVARAAAFHEKLIAEHPRCASHHNSMAWTLARCRRELDRALEHAKRAAELGPENCAILDTLAEVHFQRGEKARAIEAIGKCIELEPGVKRHRLALERFESLGPETEPPEE